VSRARVLLAAFALLVVVVIVRWLAGDAGRGGAPSTDTAVATSAGPRATGELESPSLASAPLPATREEAPSAPSPTAAAVRSTPEPASRLRTVELLVTDPAQSPLADARILVLTERQGKPAAEALTGPDGRARVELPERLSWFLSVEREGHVHVRGDFELGSSHTFVLPCAVRLTGRVLDEATRAPLADARILRPHDACRFYEDDEAHTDGHGSYELAGVPVASGRESPRFQVSHGSRPTRWESLDTSGAGETLEHDFVLATGLAVSGRVLAFPGRTPLAGVSVSAAGQHVWTDAAGRFELHLEDGLDRVRFEARGQGFATVSVSLPRARLTEQLELLVPSSSALEGTVRDGEGQPVAGADVGAYFANAGERAREDGLPGVELGLPEGHRLVLSEEGASATSDAEGRFRIEGLVPGAMVSLLVTREGFQPHREPLALSFAPGGTERHDVRLESLGCTGAIHGRVTLNGAPVKVTIHWEGPTRTGYAWARGERYELPEVECGRVRLELRLDGRTRGLFTPVELEVERGETLEHDLSLELAMGRITGRLRYASGAPVVGLAVNAFHQVQRLEGRAQSDAEGAFAFEFPVLDSPYTVAVASAGEVQRRNDALPDGPSVDFVLPDLAPLRVRVQDAESDAVIDACSLLWRRAGEARFLMAAHFPPPDGAGWRTVELPRVPLELLVRADTRGYQPAHLIGVESGAERVVELTPGLSVSFTLDPASGPFPAGHELYLLEPEVLERIRVAKDCRELLDPAGFYPFGLELRRLRFEGGSARIHGLTPGLHRFLVCPDDLALEPAEVEVKPGGTPVVLRWAPR
jgi:carboxypeptidase family protein